MKTIQLLFARKSSLFRTALALPVALVLACAAHGATITVQSTADSGGTCPGSNCTLRQAMAVANSGDTINFSFSPSDPGCRGGGLVCTITLTTGEISLDNKSLTIQGPAASAVTVSGDNNSRIFHVGENSGGPGSTFTVSNLTLTHGNSATASDNHEGGAIKQTAYYNVILNNCVLTNNSAAGPGGAIANIFSGTQINNCVISNNQGSSGGGIYANSGLTITNSTISGNQTTDPTYGDGGGILSESTATISNSTISGNTCGAGGPGGIDANNGSSILTLTNSTVSGNQSNKGTGGINVGGSGALISGCTIANNTGTKTALSGGGNSPGGVYTGNTTNFPTIQNTIIAKNSTVSDPGSYSDVSGTFISNGYNFIGDADGSTSFNQSTDQTGTTSSPKDPLLGALQDNGGTTTLRDGTHLFTMALSSTSACVDKGNSFGLTTDERGYKRPVVVTSGTHPGDGADIGAYELQIPVTVSSVVSRKNPNGVSLDIPLSLTSTVIECRRGGGTQAYEVVFTFANALTDVPGVTVQGTYSSSVPSSPNPSTLVVDLTGVANEQDLTITLTNVTDSAGEESDSISVTMGVLIGAAIGRSPVSSADISFVKAHSGMAAQPGNIGSIRADVTADGVVNSADISLTKSQSGAGITTGTGAPVRR
ncbi:MAG: hypothetical protein JO354_03235 [Verrucomicrobia bacterium]|nr:hypothetical protein [Verrucomicrobiota bacterium]